MSKMGSFVFISAPLLCHFLMDVDFLQFAWGVGGGECRNVNHHEVIILSSTRTRFESVYEKCNILMPLYLVKLYSILNN